MNLQAHYLKYTLQFKFDAGTSRGVMKTRDSWFLFIKNNDNHLVGIGEAAPLPGLSLETPDEMEDGLSYLCKVLSSHPFEYPLPDALHQIFKLFPAINFAFEMAMLDLHSEGKKILYNTPFSNGNKSIPINGLVWMGSKAMMQQQVESKIKEGFQCIKIKIGALHFEEEIELLQYIRDNFSKDLILKLDANGAFHQKDVMFKLEKLFKYKIHSIEQPIKPGQPELLQQVCSESPIPIALDEELIKIWNIEEKLDFINFIKPAYLILKPSLIGGFKATEEWIRIGEQTGIKWWLTSALESNIGLNAIAQFASQYTIGDYHGLGTGKLYYNNIASPLFINNGNLAFNPAVSWDLSCLKF